ncbi:hypothetical protein ACKUB1_06235 [Methanospirillum stamsii]|uniref:Uncharacterized protein n=1 Tax=Methanospirillum stamsii TaxID=1277351 RepID=A0A2V2NFH9_9EURY|nr:hypothetical protein [Methanospirillum stamsii]PWR75137.1 hypothetical protein DLD82_06035 [Methanospirillum stamsii]
MKTTTRVKKINGHEYLYEITYYYDKESRRTRQKSRYLGKNVDGQPVRVREKAKTPERVYAYGEFIPYLQAVKNLRIQEILGSHLTDHEVRLFLALLFAGIHHPDALHSPASWYESTVLPRVFSGLKITTQSITRLLKKLGEGSIHLSICRALSQIPDSGNMRVFSIDLPMSKPTTWNKGVTHQSIEPIVLFYDNIENIPVGYLSSARYLITSDLVKAISAGMSLFSGKKATIISGKNFESSMNLYGAIYSEIPLIFPLDPEHDLIKDEIKQHRSELMHPKNLKIFRGETLFVIPVNLTLETHHLKGYIIYSPRQEEEIRERYAEDIDLILENLNEKPIYRWVNPAEAVADVAGIYNQFLQWKVEDNRMFVDVKRKALGKYLKNSGISVIITGDPEYQWDTCLEWLEERAEAEDFITTFLKNFQVFPLTVDSDVMKNGAFLIAFIALVIERWVHEQYTKSGLLSIYTSERILLELMKIRLIGLGNERVIVTGLSSRQKEILDSLKWSAEL